MKSIQAALLVVISVVLTTGCASPQEHLQVVRQMADKGDCNGAENYARQNYSGGDMYLVLGGIEGECRRNKSAAVEYWKMCAIGGHSGCKEMLIKVGEKVPEDKRPQRVYVPQPVIQQPQQIIIQQQQPAFNPAACIQDGGGTFCPNYKR